jgi:hypothetical protein
MVRMQGAGGELRVGYAVAARLKRWSIAYDVLEAPDAEIDPYWGSEPGERSLRIKVGSSVWTWKGVDVVSLSPTLSVRLLEAPQKRPV